MNEQQLQDWLEERRKGISDAPMSPVLVLAHLVSELHAMVDELHTRLEAVENLVATPPDEAEEAEG